MLLRVRYQVHTAPRYARTGGIQVCVICGGSSACSLQENVPLLYYEGGWRQRGGFKRVEHSLPYEQAGIYKQVQRQYSWGDRLLSTTYTHAHNARQITMLLQHGEDTGQLELLLGYYVYVSRHGGCYYLCVRINVYKVVTAADIYEHQRALNSRILYTKLWNNSPHINSGKKTCFAAFGV